MTPINNNSNPTVNTYKNQQIRNDLHPYIGTSTTISITNPVHELAHEISHIMMKTYFNENTLEYCEDRGNKTGNKFQTCLHNEIRDDLARILFANPNVFIENGLFLERAILAAARSAGMDLSKFKLLSDNNDEIGLTVFVSQGPKFRLEDLKKNYIQFIWDKYKPPFLGRCYLGLPL